MGFCLIFCYVCSEGICYYCTYRIVTLHCHVILSCHTFMSCCCKDLQTFVCLEIKQENRLVSKCRFLKIQFLIYNNDQCNRVFAGEDWICHISWHLSSSVPLLCQQNDSDQKLKKTSYKIVISSWVLSSSSLD